MFLKDFVSVSVGSDQNYEDGAGYEETTIHDGVEVSQQDINFAMEYAAKLLTCDSELVKAMSKHAEAGELKEHVSVVQEFRQYVMEQQSATDEAKEIYLKTVAACADEANI